MFFYPLMESDYRLIVGLRKRSSVTWILSRFTIDRQSLSKSHISKRKYIRDIERCSEQGVKRIPTILRQYTHED